MNTNSILKRLALFLVGALIIPTFAAADIKMGIILGFTGPIESLTPDMGNSAELAFKEVSDSGQLLGGQKVKWSEQIQHVLTQQQLLQQPKD